MRGQRDVRILRQRGEPFRWTRPQREERRTNGPSWAPPSRFRENGILYKYSRGRKESREVRSERNQRNQGNYAEQKRKEREEKERVREPLMAMKNIVTVPKCLTVP